MACLRRSQRRIRSLVRHYIVVDVLIVEVLLERQRDAHGCPPTGLTDEERLQIIVSHSHALLICINDGERIHHTLMMTLVAVES